MNLRALALGVTIGFLAAVIPSCSGGGGGACSAANCSGCCSGNTCVKPTDNAKNTTCGTAGQACKDCASFGQNCTTSFACSGGAVGGGAGGGSGGGTGGSG